MNPLLDFWTPFPPALRLVGRRVVVRTPRPGDWHAWSALRAQSWSFLQPWEPTWTVEALTRPAFRRRLRQYAADWEQDEGYSFLIFTSDEREQLLGGIALTNVRRGVADSGVIGYWMGEVFAGQGYMSEALPLILDFAFETLRLHRVEAACLETNERSRKLLEKSGFSPEGRARGLLKIDGAWRDHILFAILRDDPRGPGRG
jgi:ribosomal-protein-alanine N-acetyltransferase